MSIVRNHHVNRRISVLFVCLVVLAWTSGCAGTKQTRSATPQGFLGDYSMLKEGQGEQAQLVYVNPKTDFSTYGRIYLEPITVWVAPGSSLHDVDQEDLQRLADYLYAALRRELEFDYVMVNQPGPGTLRVRAAITEARKSKVVLDIVSSVLPQARLVTSAIGLATDMPSAVGSTSIEVDITDSLSGERLAAVVDERSGTKSIRGAHRTWGDVDDAYDVWAEKLRTRLSQLRDDHSPQ